MQLLLQSFRVFVCICQKVNILGKAPSGEELKNVKYNSGCQMSSGKALDSCVGSRNYQKATGPRVFAAATQTLLTLFLITAVVRVQFRELPESLQSSVSVVHSSPSWPLVYNLQVVLWRRSQRVPVFRKQRNKGRPRSAERT